MDDTEDDARYPPIPYPPNRRRPPPPSRRIPPPTARTFPAAADFADDDDDDDGEDDINPDLPIDDDEPDPYARRRTRPADDGDSSSDSRGKRRRLDKYALGFEFAPRAAASAAAKPPPPLLPPAPLIRNSPGDWTEEATFVLLDAWGELYLQNGRKSIRSDEWSEVAKKVREASKIVRSDAQCRNRLDTLKKKYRKEKAKIAEGISPDSKWPYFAKMDFLMQSPTPSSVPAPRHHHQQPPQPRMSYPVAAGEYAYANSRAYARRPDGMDESPGDTGTDDYDDEDDDGSDMPPPRRERFPGGSESSFRMLANSIQKFGEMYEKIEHNKRQQMAELERMRKEFHRDLEAQMRQILERAQVQIAKILEEVGEEDQEEEERSQEEEDNDDGVDVST